MPPSSEIRERLNALSDDAPRRIVPSVQLAECNSSAPVRATTLPSESRVLVSMPSATNASHSPSGEKNGPKAFSAPGTGLAVPEPRWRTKTWPRLPVPAT